MAFFSIPRLLLHGLLLIPFYLTLTSAQTMFGCPPKDPFDWESITPSKTIDWTPCYETYFCARFKVPFDYANPQGDEFAIALLKVPANISTSDPAYRGPILLNPGGPGGSGVDLALGLGSLSQTLLGADYDIIGFDPRGVSRTTPGIDVFKGENAQRELWGIRAIDAPSVSDSVNALPRIIAMEKLGNKLFADKEASTAPYVGTAAVARDMLSIVEALGQEKLQYWGVSYGSVLGMTFASLFPDKVGRILVDGIVDANAWYKGNYTGFVRDTDSVIRAVASQCAGTIECPLHEATAEAVEKRLLNLFESLRSEVVTLYDGVKTMVLIDRNIALASLFVVAYFPYQGMAPLFEAYSYLEKGNGFPLYNLISNSTGNFTVTCQDCYPPVAQAGASPDADISIQCADAGAQSDDPTFLKGLYDAVAAQTQLADAAFGLAVRCVGWSLESKSRFEGTVGGDTSFPLLFIGNTHDNITPLQNAFTMSPLFKGSAVLTRDAIGHTSLSGTSPCTYKIIREYFRDGVLPSPGTTCSDITDPVFGKKTAPTKRALGHDDIEKRMSEVAKVLSKNRFRRAFGV